MPPAQLRSAVEDSEAPEGIYANRSEHLVEVPVASVILCTRNRAGSVIETLRSLEEEKSQSAAELIVVDNGSTDETPAVLERWAQQSRFPVQLVRESAVGLSNARNAGVRRARGRYLLFLDDDVIVHKHWVDELIAAFQPGVEMVGGRILPRYTFDPPEWLRGGGAVALSLMDYGERAFDMGGRQLPLGASMAIRADSLRALDPDVPFPPELGHTGTISTGYEEIFIAWRLSGRITYAPAAVVDHVVAADRADFQRARRTYFQLGFGRARSDRLLGRPEPRLSYRIARMIWIIGKVAVLRAVNHRKSKLTPELAIRELMAYHAAGHHLDQLLSTRQRVADWLARSAV